MINYGIVNYIFGAPGSGKTTVLAYLAKKYNKMGFKVYCNTPIKNTILIDDEMIGYIAFTDSVLLLDECGIQYNNRDAFKKKSMMSDPDRLRYWKLVRHYVQKNKKGCVWIASQGWNDIDLKLRTLSTNYFYIKKFVLPWWTVIKPIFKKCDIDDQTHEPTDFYVFDMFWNFKLIFRPKYYKLFDSYDAPILPEYDEYIKKIEEKKENENSNHNVDNIYNIICG